MGERGLELVEQMLGGDRLALARLITLVENRSPLLPEIMRRVHPKTGRAYTLGVTGPPGAGKSTLVDGLTRLIRGRGQTVSIVAVDPTSPFTGGAVLGDRIRMQDHSLDPGVFIRSMATRGSLGGLARATADVQKLLDAAGADWVLIETVGVGQTELDIVKLADTTLVVLVPESGDAVQTMKAGLLEVADLFVVNKADRPGAHALVTELKFMVHLSRQTAPGQRARREKPPEGSRAWETPVLTSCAATGEGLEVLLGQVDRHRTEQEESGTLETRRQARRARELRELILAELRLVVEEALADGGALAGLVEDVETGRRDPHGAIREVVERLRAGELRDPVPDGRRARTSEAS